MNKRYMGDDKVKQALGSELEFDIFFVIEGAVFPRHGNGVSSMRFSGVSSYFRNCSAW